MREGRGKSCTGRFGRELAGWSGGEGRRGMTWGFKGSGRAVASIFKYGRTAARVHGHARAGTSSCRSLQRKLDGWTGARMGRGGQARVQTPMTGQKCAQRDGGTSTLDIWSQGWDGWGVGRACPRYLGTWLCPGCCVCRGGGCVLWTTPPSPLPPPHQSTVGDKKGATQKVECGQALVGADSGLAVRSGLFLT